MLFLATSETSVVECAFMDNTSRNVLDEQFVLPLVVVLSLVPSPITSRSAAEAARGGEHEGPPLDEEVLDDPEELRQPVVGVGGAQEDQGQERFAL